MKTILIYTLGLTAAIPAFADAGYSEPVYGSARSAKIHPTISMVSETVDIEILKDGVNVEATFTFVNDGPATDVPMYMPLIDGIQKIGVYDKSVYSYDGTAIYVKTTSAFDVKEDETGKLVWTNHTLSDWEKRDRKYFEWDSGTINPILYYIETFNAENNGKPVETYIVDLLDGEDWLVYGQWTVPFAEGEEKTVRCSYFEPFRYGHHGTPVTPHFYYVLYTGGSWAGPIGDGTITVRRSLDLDYPIIFASPGNRIEQKEAADDDAQIDALFSWNRVPSILAGRIMTTDTEEEVVWEFEDYEPNPDDMITVFIGGRTPGRNQYSFMDGTYGEYLDDILGDYGLPKGGIPGVTTGAGLNFRVEPLLDAGCVTGREKLGYYTVFSILESRGEWWKVRTVGGYEGWIRWRYVDPDTGIEYVYASFLESIP